MSLRLQKSSNGTSFLSFFSIATTESGETFIEQENDDIKQLLTPVAEKLRSIGSIEYGITITT